MFNKPLILSGTGVTPVYKINQSIRFDSSANAHMDRTPSSAGNQKRGHLVVGSNEESWVVVNFFLLLLMVIIITQV